MGESGTASSLPWRELIAMPRKDALRLSFSVFSFSKMAVSFLLFQMEVILPTTLTVTILL